MTGMAGDGRLGIVDMLSGYRTPCPEGRAKGSMGEGGRADAATRCHNPNPNPVSETVGVNGPIQINPNPVSETVGVNGPIQINLKGSLMSISRFNQLMVCK